MGRGHKARTTRVGLRKADSAEKSPPRTRQGISCTNGSKRSDAAAWSATAADTSQLGRRHDSPCAPPHRLRLTSAKPLRISFDGWRRRGLGD